MRPADFRLELEQEVMIGLFDLFKTISLRSHVGVMTFRDSTLHPPNSDMDFIKESAAHAKAPEYAQTNGIRSPPTNETRFSENCRSSSLLPSVVPIRAPWQQRKLLFMGMVVSVIVLFQLIVFPCKSCLPTISRATKGSVFVMVGSASLSNSSILTSIDLVRRGGNNSTAFKAGDEAEVEDLRKDNDSLEIDEGGQSQNGITSEGILDLDNSLRMRYGIKTNNRSSRGMGLEIRLDPIGYVNESGKSFALQESKKTKSISILGDGHNRSGFESLSIVSPRISANEITNLDKVSRTQHLQTVSASSSNISLVAGNSMASKRGIKPMSISQMTILLRKSSDVSKSMRPRWSSPRDRELQFARSQIENAPIIRNSPEHYASLFRNFSMFTSGTNTKHIWPIGLAI
ncbi:hypothetical protein U1Q18_024427 [Sarracenia purpurea var. burkii]